MRKPLLSLAVPIVAIALAVTALAVLPGVMTTLSPGSPSRLAAAAVSWKVGDTWTYNITFPATGEDSVIPHEMMVAMHENESHVIGTFTETVVGNVSTEAGAAWNVTETLTLFVGHDHMGMGSDGGIQTLDPHPFNVSGFVWYRQSDLAPLYARNSVHMVRTWNVTGTDDGWSFDHGVANGTYTLTYDAGTEVWFHPALTVFRFPLAENTTYNVTSNATIHTWKSFQVSGPNVTYGTTHFSNVTVPIDFGVRTGRFENVTTPAGTFRALPISAYRKPFHSPEWDHDANEMTNLTLETDCVNTPHAFATGWFSPEAGNFVKVDLGLGRVGEGAPRIELTLVSFSTG